MSSDIRMRIVGRAAKDLRASMNVNVGIGLPTPLANHAEQIPGVLLQSENGLLGIGPYPRRARRTPTARATRRGCRRH
jgi:acyl CoA:acetate/3-ketoacid CoA transferase beta subunit